MEAELHGPDQTKSETSFTVTIIDTCVDAVVNSDAALVLQDFIAPDDVSSFESSTYFAPSNSVRISSGGLSNCGPLSYTLLTQEK